MISTVLNSCSGGNIPIALLAASIAGAQGAEVGNGLAIIYAILMFAIAILQVINFFKPNPALHRQFADKEETERRISSLEQDLKHLHSHVGASENRILAAGEERAVLIHKRINDASESLKELRGEVKHLGTSCRDAANAAHAAAIAAARGHSHSDN